MRGQIYFSTTKYNKYQEKIFYLDIMLELSCNQNIKFGLSISAFIYYRRSQNFIISMQNTASFIILFLSKIF